MPPGTVSTRINSPQTGWLWSIVVLFFFTYKCHRCTLPTEVPGKKQDRINLHLPIGYLSVAVLYPALQTRVTSARWLCPTSAGPSEAELQRTPRFKMAAAAVYRDGDCVTQNGGDGRVGTRWLDLERQQRRRTAAPSPAEVRFPACWRDPVRQPGPCQERVPWSASSRLSTLWPNKLFLLLSRILSHSIASSHTE